MCYALLAIIGLGLFTWCHKLEERIDTIEDHIAKGKK